MTKLVDLILETEPEFFRQPNDYTCGPSAVYMLSRALGKLNSFEEIKKMTHANPLTGALPMFIASTLRRLGLQAHKAKARSGTEVAALAVQGPVILLGVLDGWPHWVLVYQVQNGRFQVADPSAGMRDMSTSDIDAFLSPKRLKSLFRIIGGMLGTAFQVQH
jgi:ABC-type bacteriocin/lantibiotic exporter with double-glycine peptidase domain